MIKLTSIDPGNDRCLLLHFSDGARGILDFTPFIAVETAMTEPLREPAFFAKAFIELGALAWPNGFELSAESLYRRLGEAGSLQRDTAVA
jgi:hypothetical protein